MIISSQSVQRAATLCSGYGATTTAVLHIREMAGKQANIRVGISKSLRFGCRNLPQFHRKSVRLANVATKGVATVGGDDAEDDSLRAR